MTSPCTIPQVPLVIHMDLPCCYAMLQIVRELASPSEISSALGYSLCTFEAAVEYTRNVRVCEICGVPHLHSTPSPSPLSSPLTTQPPNHLFTTPRPLARPFSRSAYYLNGITPTCSFVPILSFLWPGLDWSGG